MPKLEKILEAMDSFKINSEVALLENESLDALTVAQAKKSIHESFNFIKNELIAGGVLEETQMLLSDAWTQAIMEDIQLPSVEDVKDFGNHVAGGAQMAGHAVMGNAGVLSGAAQGGNLGSLNLGQIPQNIANAAKQGYSEGYQTNAPSPIVDYKVGEFVGEHPVATVVGGAAALGGAALGTSKLIGKVRRATPKA